MEYPDDLLHLPKCAIHNRANTVANVVRSCDYAFLFHVQIVGIYSTIYYTIIKLVFYSKHIK